MNEPKPPNSTALDIIIYPYWNISIAAGHAQFPTYGSWEGLRRQLSPLVLNARILLILETYYYTESDRSVKEFEVFYLVF
jgi:hypothetical protein